MNFNLNILFSALINNFIQFAVTAKVINKKINYKSFRYYIALFFSTLYVYVSYDFVQPLIRIILLLYIFALSIYFIFIEYKLDIYQLMIISLFNWLVFFFGELLFSIIIVLLLKINVEEISKYFFGNFISNCCIDFIYILIATNKYTISLLNNLLRKQSKISINVVLLFATISVMVFGIIIYLVYFKVNFFFTLLCDIFILVFYFIIVLKLFKEKSKAEHLQLGYNILLNNLKEYEKMLDYQRVANHENKNQLLVIKGMLKKKEKNIDKYIDSIITDVREDNEILYGQTAKIPSGGLRGLVYYKTLIMKEKNINVEMDIDNKIRKVDFESLDSIILKDLCKIVGVILDNAIEAVELLDDRYIRIDMESDDSMMVIKVSNNFEGDIDLTNMDEKGYTTKSQGHGYGLSLVRELVTKHSEFSNRKKIDSKIFTQIIEFGLK